jgi:hypothetical protein
MASILGTVWTIQRVTLHTPFPEGAEVEITSEGDVRFGGQEWKGEYDAAKNKVTVVPETGLQWEFVASEEKQIGDEPGKYFTMYGCSWTATKPDAMGSWVSDPQGTP